MPFLKFFVTDFSELKKAGHLKVHINIDNDWMYRIYQIRGKRFINSWSYIPWYVFKQLKCILLNNFYVCGPS